MNDKVYYGQRKNYVGVKKLELDEALRLFRNKIDLMISELYFLESTGYHCTDKARVVGKWGSDIEIFIYDKIYYEQIWPIKEYYSSYTEEILFTVIEFLYDYVSEPIDKWYHEWNNCGWHCSKFDKEAGQEKYRVDINNILNKYGEGYILSEDGEVQRLADTGFESLVYEKINTEDKDNIDNRVNGAINKFLHYKSNLDDKKGALLALFGVLEYLKTCNKKLDGKDSSDLFNIMNGFDLRHHQKVQQKDYQKDEWYEWLFYTCLSSIKLLVKLKES
ncbi:hypothetical protein [Clostridium gasigenes]|uniref:Uncharacterized protein n=1 Tax=Clostridium gasigenes TaxID=94869 RepID=A0A1H0S1U0_9CLOT|nr:hypothetical protein [Clostridium gasigenes]SDP35732.1 hypothetical protein SAMN04488529_104123 [Clostridium gasigenes]